MEDPATEAVEDLAPDTQQVESPEPLHMNGGTEKETNTAGVKVSQPPKVARLDGPNKRRLEAKVGPSLKAGVSTSGLNGTKKSTLAPAARRNSTGGLAEKQSAVTGRSTSGASTGSKKSIASASAPLRRSLPEMRISSFSAVAKDLEQAGTVKTKKSSPVSPAAVTSRVASTSDAHLVRKPSFTQSTVSSLRKSGSPSMESTDSSGTVRKSTSRLSSSLIQSPLGTSGTKSVSKFSSVSTRSPSMSSGSKNGSLASPQQRTSNSSGGRKTASAERKDSHFIILPQVEIKAGDDVRLDLRGHRIRSLNGSGMSLSPNLEFVYLRDNMLASLEGIEMLTRVKVLDLSFNDFKGPGFEPLGNCQVLQQLYLAGNQITSLSSLPELPNLEFLSVAQNKLKSLSMASQPRLQVLAASKNKISILKGFPYLPVLEHLRLEENPILRMPHLQAASILLVGPTLKKFNDRDLSNEEVAIAKQYPAHAALCIRDGWELCAPENAAGIAYSTFEFLVERWVGQLPPGFQLKEASIDPPFVEDACRCHFIFAQDHGFDAKLVLQYQWYLGDRALSDFVAIPEATSEVYCPKRDDVNKLLKIECIPILGEMKYPPIYAMSSLVSPGTGCPKVLNLEVRGELVEGNVVRGLAEVAWCGGSPGKGVCSWLRRRWNSSPVVIAGAEDEEYLLSIDDVDSSLVFMYTPVTEEGIKGEPQYAITEFIKAAPPLVSNVQIIGDLVEGNIIKGIGAYFGGREGPSKFEWLRENMDTGDFVPVLAGATEYTLTREDVGRRMAFVYIPTNFEGKEGESASVVSDVVKQAPPKVTNLKIIGDIREGSKVTVTGTVTGGTEGASRVQWFKSSCAVVDGEDDLEALSTLKVTKAFRIPLGAVGQHIIAKFIPMTPDGEAGQPVYAISDKTVETLPPSLNFLSITGEYVEGEILTVSYGYIGGHEGKSIYNWYIHQDETKARTLIHDVSGVLQYRVSKDAIGKYVSFECTPVRDDGLVGEPRTCMGEERIRAGNPRLFSLKIAGKCVEGTTLHVEKNYWGGEEGESIFRWFRTSLDGPQIEINGANRDSHTLSVDDIDSFISVSCEPTRSDWVRGPTVLSEQIGPILPGPPTCKSLQFSGLMMEGQRISFIVSYSGGIRGNCVHEWFRLKNDGVKEKLCVDEFLDLSLQDIGSCIEIVFTPVRSDGEKGSPQSIISSVILPADPTGLQLTIPDGCEDKEVIPERKYFGGVEGVGEYVWYRMKDKLHGSSLTPISASHQGVTVCGHKITYTPSLHDVGYYLALNWVPTREDGLRGQPITAICSSPVSAAFPVVTNVHVKESSTNIYVGEGQYFGGHEGASLFSWYRETVEGTISLISDAISQSYEVTDSDYNCRLLFGYTPVRSDSVVGELRLSEQTDIILPELPHIEFVALNGKAIEGEILTAVEVIPESKSQQYVWGKYRKDVSYQWYRSSEAGDNDSFEALPSQHSCSYRIRFEDIGHCLKCECIMSDVFGRSSEPAYAETSQILPGVPRIAKLEIEGRGFHTNLYAIKGTYSGGKEGKSRIQWLRSMVGSPDLISIPGETGRMYESNVDDVGYRLVAIYTPVREDGVEGMPVSASTEPITVEPDVLAEVKNKLDLGSVKFEVLCDKEQSSKKSLGLGCLERRILEVNRKRVKVIKPGSKTSFANTEVRGTYAPPFHVVISRNDQHRLKIVVDSDSEVDMMVHTRHLRDVIVLVLRGLAQRFNSTSLNSLLKIET